MSHRTTLTCFRQLYCNNSDRHTTVHVACTVSVRYICICVNSSFVALGSGTTDNFYWPLNSNTSDGTLDGDPFPMKSISAGFYPDMTTYGTRLNGSGQSINLGGEAGTCLTHLEFCQTLNFYFLFLFAGRSNGDQYIVSRTTTSSSKSGFYIRYDNMDDRLPLRYYFQVSISSTKPGTILILSLTVQWNKN